MICKHFQIPNRIFTLTNPSDNGGKPPCTRCCKEGQKCELGSSNRGGSRIRKKKVRHDSISTSATSSLKNVQNISTDTSQVTLSDVSPRQYPILRPDEVGTVDANDESEVTIPRNPSDAWQLLKEVARDDRPASHASNVPSPNNMLGTSSAAGGSGGIASYRLVREGYLTPTIISSLVKTYAEHYHAYLPLVPRKYFDLSALDYFAANDKHLLTAVLTIASKDLIEAPNVHMCCSRYMHDLVSGIAAGHDCEVEAVEALLLLAEWEPQGLRNQIESVGRGEEDRASWLHVGMAIRSGYWLGLDRTAFRSEAPEEAKTDGRKRLAWASCYISDRLISVRIGKAFWSRGPGPMTDLSSKDFPSLQPVNPGDEDYARILEATLSLTQLYSNIHDILYNGMRTSGQMMLMGDYVKHIDDFRSSIARWHRMWGNLVCSHHVKSTILLSYDYLRLYTNAFAFQGMEYLIFLTFLVHRLLTGCTSCYLPGYCEQAKRRRQQFKRAFERCLQQYRSYARSIHIYISDIVHLADRGTDARFIYESVAAAKSYLTTLNSCVDPEKHLRYMPLRFYLYTIYSHLFLYKARSYGIIIDSEDLILGTMDVLKRSSVSSQDAGSRYAKLLELLWQKPRSGTTDSQPPAHRRSESQQSGSLPMDPSGYPQFSPANNFSWLDLEAVGDYVSGEQMPGTNMLVPISGYQAQPTVAQVVQPGAQWQAPVAYNWQFDLNGNLLF